MTQIKKNLNVGILAGGFSQERDVSLRSGKNVFESLTRLGYTCSLIDPKETAIQKKDMDIAFIALHGHFGEDGTIQTLLEKQGIPYTGSPPEASLKAMNKLISKQIMHEHGIPSPDFLGLL